MSIKISFSLRLDLTDRLSNAVAQRDSDRLNNAIAQSDSEMFGSPAEIEEALAASQANNEVSSGVVQSGKDPSLISFLP